jgi:branched-chain amino acid transport system substrate-binding protein
LIQPEQPEAPLEEHARWWHAALGTKVKLMGSDGINKWTFVEEAGVAAEGTYASFPAVPGPKLTGKGAEWYERYKQLYLSGPDPYAAYAYDAANVALQGIDGNRDERAPCEEWEVGRQHHDDC